MHKNEWVLHINANNLLHYVQEDNGDITISMFSYSTLIYKVACYKDNDNDTYNCFLRYMDFYTYIREFLPKYFDTRWKKNKDNQTLSRSTINGVDASVNSWVNCAFKYEKAYLAKCFEDTKYRLERRIFVMTDTHFDIETKEIKKED